MRHRQTIQTKSDSIRVSTVCSQNVILKGTATLMITIFNTKDLNKPGILIPVSSKSVGKYGSCWRLNICKWTVIEAAIL